MQRFDPNRPGDIEGEVTVVSISQPPSPTQGDSNLVLDPNDEFNIHIEWEVFGELVPIWLPGLADMWRVEVFAESLGAGPELRIGSESVKKVDFHESAVHSGKPHCRRWMADVAVPANTLEEGDPGGSPTSPSGLYRLAATVFLNSSLGPEGFDMAGFSLGPAVLVEDPV